MLVSRKEALRYLGYGQAEADASVLSLLEWAIESLIDSARFGNVRLIFDCEVNEASILLGALEIRSKDLSKHLQGCNKAVLFAATLGPQADILLKKYAHLDISKAVILQAAAAAIIEAYCNGCQEILETSLLAESLYVRPRFSPGYGDFSLEHQPKILSLLDAPRKIGLTITGGMMLAPSKSVTAVMGLSKNPEIAHKSGCADCSKQDCSYRQS